ncbi:hypothetical protein AVEN_55165-1 [Araneus ventricosus]|uniref:Uncharacterized protein n=1 Tax=Araneus ventricosus TaxID=182803 RepID=A0A4Y2HLC1_ARAVE|nr:hypothetical protein AVEN_55165-1 [Araneus ventricosus]
MLSFEPKELLKVKYAKLEVQRLKYFNVLYSMAFPTETRNRSFSLGSFRLRREWCQARAHWRKELRSVVFSKESRFCLGASDGRVLVRRRLSERLQLTCLRPRHTGRTPGVMVWGANSYDSRSTLVVIPRTLTANLYVSLVIQPVVLLFMNSIQGVFSNRITLALIPLHQIFLQSITYGTLFDDSSIFIHNQH